MKLTNIADEVRAFYDRHPYPPPVTDLDDDRRRWLRQSPYLPHGAAAVLINQSHTYTDLVLPIGEAQKRLFEAIDGQQTIAEILDNPVRGGDGRVRDFFEKLWWYDQVVFDASRHRGTSDDGTI